jgi:hypothetical protein
MTLMTALQAPDMAAAGITAPHAIRRAWSAGVAVPANASGHVSVHPFAGCSGDVTRMKAYVGTGLWTTPSTAASRPWDPLL